MGGGSLLILCLSCILQRSVEKGPRLVKELSEEESWRYAADWEIRPVVPGRVAGKIDAYGYMADGLLLWAPHHGVPYLRLSVQSHVEKAGHTWYLIQCALELSDGVRLEWPAPRRLLHLQRSLHMQVKDMLGPTYAALFDGVHFVSRGGLMGTTRQVDAWLHRFADLINTCRVPPCVVGLALRFFQAPQPTEAASNAEAIRA